MKGLKPITILLSTLLLTLLFINIYIFSKRSHGFGYRYYANYQALYLAQEGKWIEELECTAKAAFIKLKGLKTVDADVTILVDSMHEVTGRIDGQVLQIPFNSGVHHYECHLPVNGKINVLRFVFDAPVLDKNATSNVKPELINSSLFIPKKTPFSIKRWVMNGSKSFNDEELNEGLIKLEMEAPGFKRLLFKDKLKVIGRLATQCNGPLKAPVFSNSVPADQSATQLFKKAETQRYRLSCGDMSYLASWLLVSAQIPVRSVTFKDSYETWSNPVHYFLEIFDTSRGEWLFFDPLNNLLCPVDKQGNYINTVQLQQAYQLNPDLPEMYAVFSTPDSNFIRPLGSWKTELYPYFSLVNQPVSYNMFNDKRKTNLFSRIFNFYSFPENEMIYSTQQQNDWPKIWLKLLSFYGFFTVLAFMFFNRLKRRFSR